MSCHSLSKAGGEVGPDLSALGQTSPPDYIINSIYNPDQAIKEQYHTLVVQTSDGQVFQGIVTDKDDQRIVLKEATGAPRVVPVAVDRRPKAGRLAHAQGPGEPDDAGRVRRPGPIPLGAGKAGPVCDSLNPHNSALEGLEAGLRSSCHAPIPDKGDFRDQVLKAEPEPLDDCLCQGRRVRCRLTS